MKFHEIAGRLTGLNCPIFGISSHPAPGELSVARRVLGFLEDRWVLFSPSEIENPEHCVESVLEIREFLAAELPGLEETGELSASLRAMRGACAKFLHTVDHGSPRIIAFANKLNHYAGWVFGGALGELRGAFGIHIARLAAQHGLDVQDDLAAILPGRD